MPRNARRIAARQAELGTKKRKTKRSASVDNSSPVYTRDESIAGMEPVSTQPKKQLAQEVPSITVENSSNKLSYKSSNNPYIWPEIKRIMSITTLVFIIMAALTVVIN